MNKKTKINKILLFLYIFLILFILLFIHIPVFTKVKGVPQSTIPSLNVSELVNVNRLISSEKKQVDPPLELNLSLYSYGKEDPFK